MNMECSSHTVDPELITAPLLNTYHPADTASSPEEMKARRERQQRRFLIDTCI